MWIKLHRIDGTAICLKAENIDNLEEYRNHCSINAQGFNYLVDESLDTVLGLMKAVPFESLKEIPRVAKTLVLPELKPRKTRRRKNET